MGRAASGATLMEVVIATALAALALAISYPALERGLEGMRLRTAAEQAGELLVSAQLYADRQREAVLMQIDPPSGQILATSESGRWERNLSLREPIRIAVPPTNRAILLHPGDLLPDLEISLAARGPASAGFRADPLQGAVTYWKASE